MSYRWACLYANAAAFHMALATDAGSLRCAPHTRNHYTSFEKQRPARFRLRATKTREVTRQVQVAGPLVSRLVRMGCCMGSAGRVSALLAYSIYILVFNNNGNKHGGIVENRRRAMSAQDYYPHRHVDPLHPPSTAKTAFVIFPERCGGFQPLVSHS